VIDGNLSDNMKHARKLIKEAARKGTDLICLPEAADLGWLCQDGRKLANPIPGRYTDFLSDLAKKFHVWISAGCLENDRNKTYNSAVLIDRSGKIILKHRKINTLPGLTSHIYDAGSADDIKVVSTEFGLIGITICADNFDIKNPQKVADLGAWLLITPHGFAARLEDLPDNSVSFMNHIKKIAKETKLWVIGTNTGLSLVAGGAWKGQLHSGCSTIADPSGKAMIIGKFKMPDMVFYDIPAEK
jgi:predicted amidohydrolase